MQSRPQSYFLNAFVKRAAFDMKLCLHVDRWRSIRVCVQSYSVTSEHEQGSCCWAILRCAVYKLNRVIERLQLYFG